MDEVSVVKLEYTDSDFCKQHGKKHEDPSNERKYFGLACIKVGEIHSCDADIVFTPNSDNPAHADIQIGIKPEKRVELPSEFQYKVDEIARISRLFKDPNVTSSTWDGDELK